MEHIYYGIWDNVAKCYAWIGESKNDQTFARMCSMMQKDEKTFIGQSPQVDFRCFKVGMAERLGDDISTDTTLFQGARIGMASGIK